MREPIMECAHAAVKPSRNPDHTMKPAHAAVEATHAAVETTHAAAMEATSEPASPDGLNKGRGVCC
jgi:hypothetical protein